MKKIITLFLTVTALITSAQSSRSIDSIKTLLQSNREDTATVNTINDLCTKLRSDGDLIGAKSYAEKGILLSEKLGWRKGEANCYMQIGSTNIWLSNYPDASKSYLKALRIREGLKDEKGVAYTYMGIGNVYYYQKNYTDAIKNYKIGRAHV
jgi:tetratricopeptide (TPR) repeat protein